MKTIQQQMLTRLLEFFTIVGITTITVIFTSSLQAQTSTIDFDADGNWTAGSGAITSYQSDHVYADLNWSFTGGPALRNTTSTTDGFPGALGTYSWRLRDASGVDWRGTFNSTATITEFGFQFRRWDGSPAINYTVSYSTNGGSSWTTAGSITDPGDVWQSFSHTLSSPATVTSGQFVVRVVRNSGERLMIDDFEWTESVGPPCTEPAASASGFTIGSITAASISASFTGVTADNYLVTRHPNPTPSATPNDTDIYAVDDMIGDATVVYNGSSTSFTASGLTASTLYYFSIYPYNSECTGGPDYRVTSPLIGSASTNDITPIEQGDLAIVAINTQFGGGNPDEVCFVAFKDIDPGASFSFTDNGYERVNVGEWGDSEGGYILERDDDASTITAGTVICLQGFGATDTVFDIYTCGVLDTANWTITNLNLGAAVNLNTSDQLWILGSGTWTNPAGNHNATFDGEVLFGWTATGWETDPGYASTAGSTIPDGVACYNTDVNGVTNPDKVKYTGLTTDTTQYQWLVRINDPSNWTGYANDTDYNAGGPDYSGDCVEFGILAGGFTAGEWRGQTSTDWFECANWQNFQVPLTDANVVISTTAANEAIIDDDSPNAALYDPTPTIASLTIEDGLWVELDDSSDSLIVTGNVVVENGGLLENDVNGLLDIDGSLTIENSGQFDLTNSRLELAGDYNNNSSAANFFESGSTVTLNGAADQNLGTSGFEDTFSNLTIEKSGGAVILQDNMVVAGTMAFGSSTLVETGSNRLTVSNTATGAITGYGTSAYVNGNLRRNVSATGTYDLPVGSASNYELATVELNSSAGLTYLDASFNTAAIPAPVGLISNGPLGLPDSITPIIGFLNAGYWEIDPNAGATVDYDITLTSRGHDNAAAYQNFHGGFKNDDASVATDWEEAGTVFFASAGTGPALGSTDVVSVTNTGITSFSDFAIGFSNATVLPITLVSFTATPQQADALLEWTTASEIDNDHFEILHSRDGVQWTVIGQVEGAGTSVTECSYSFLHPSPGTGMHYYQLEQVDLDGQSTMSDIAFVQFTTSEDIVVYPNPVAEQLQVTAGVDVQLFNAAGQLVLQTFTDGRPLNVSGLPGGIYTLRLTSGSQVIVSSLIKL